MKVIIPLAGKGTRLRPHTHVTPFRFLASPGLLAGLVIFALFVAAAVRMRRSSTLVSA